MSLTTLVPLGTNGFFASHSRLTMAFLALGLTENSRRAALLLDAGSGVGRLVEDRVVPLLDDIEHLDIILTHYHLDHVCGLPALPAILAEIAKSNQSRVPTVSLFVPDHPLVDCDPKIALGNLLEPPLFPSTVEAFHRRITIVPYTCAEDLLQLQIQSPAAVRKQFHPGGSVGLRFGDQLAYITDTRASESTIEFVRDVDLLIHEAWVTHTEAVEDPRTVAGHTDFKSLRRIAELAGVQKLMPVHHHPANSTEALRAMHRELASTKYQLTTSVEGAPLKLDGRPPPTATFEH